MRVLIFHGYLLRGTGSNVYNASLAQALARLGHDVHLLCQDRRAAALPWVDAVGSWESGRLRVEGTGRRPAPASVTGPSAASVTGPAAASVTGPAAASVTGPAAGSVTVYVPDIGGLLPVFVHDEYEGFRVRTFGELTAAELRRYIDANVVAVGEVAERADGVDAALANHLVMGPVILARAGLRYALKVHGSDLSYTVLPDIERFGPYAEEGVEGAAGILVGSRHIAGRLRLAVGDLGDRKLALGPPGVDADRFSPVAPEAAPQRLRELAARLAAEGDRGEPEGRGAAAWGRDAERAARAVEAFAAAEPRVGFVGKLIVSKGVDLLAAAWPLVRARHRGAGLLVVGFGELERGLRMLIDALAAGDLDRARALAARGRGLEGGREGPLAILSSFLADPPPGYREAARAAAGSIWLCGRLEHDEVGALLPAVDALAFPSTFPEAFGMVAAEAAAAGALPVSAAHSGALEVSRTLAAELADDVAGLLSFPVGPGGVEALAERLNGWLGLDPGRRVQARATLARTAAELWSWEGVARAVIAASRGDLDRLGGIEQ